MMPESSYNIWDIALILVVALQGTALAYLYNPKWKALVLTLPIPFTVSVLAIGRPIDATNVTGLIALLLFTNGVRWLHWHARCPIIISIVVASAGYCVIGAILAKLIPPSDLAFWLSCAFVLILAGFLHFNASHREEKGKKLELAVWLKFPILVCVVCLLVLMKRALLGFMTVFPMVGVIAAYEGRHCLGTISRQIPVVMLTLVPMMMVCRLSQPQFGLPAALGLGWAALFMILIPITGHMWRNNERKRTLQNN